MTGDQFAAACNLLSDWFTLTDALPRAGGGDGRRRPTARGYWIAGSRRHGGRAFGDAAHLGSAGRAAAGRTGGGHGRHARRAGLLGGGRRRRHLHLRRRRLLRVDRRHPPQPARSSAWPRTPDGRGYWLVASDGGIFAFGDAGFYGLDRAPSPQPARRGHGGHPRRRRLLAGGLRRRHLRLRRRRLLRVDGRPPAQPPDRGHGRRPGRRPATGWWPPTAASSPSATPASTARPGATPWCSRSWAWRPPTAAATGWWLRRRHLQPLDGTAVCVRLRMDRRGLPSRRARPTTPGRRRWIADRAVGYRGGDGPTPTGVPGMGETAGHRARRQPPGPVADGPDGRPTARPAEPGSAAWRSIFFAPIGDGQTRRRGSDAVRLGLGRSPSWSCAGSPPRSTPPVSAPSSTP